MNFRQFLSGQKSEQTDITCFDDTFAHFTNPVILLSSEGKILRCNRAVQELYSLENTEFKNQDYFAWCSQHNIQPVFPSLQNFLAESDAVAITNIIQGKHTKSIQWIISPVKDNEQEQYIYLIGMDATKLAQISNKANYIRDSIIDLLPNHYIFWKDRNSVYLGCNKALALSAQLSSTASIIGKTDYDLPWSKEESERYRADDLRVMETKNPILNIEEPQTLPNGKKIILSTCKVPLFDEKGEVYGVLAIYSDITQQKVNEWKIIENNKKLENAYQGANFLRNSIIDHLPNHFIFWKDRNSVFLGCNKAFALSAKLSDPGEIIGKTDYDLPWTKEESDRYRADDLQVMDTQQAKLNIEETQTLANGEKIVLSTSKMPLFNEQGEVYGVLAIYSDITKQKQNEQQLLEINKKLENSHKVKSEFIRNVSHDIRTPLAGIQQVTRALADGMIPAQEVSAYAASAWEASNKLMELFDQILDVSKKEHFDFEDQIVKFDLYRLLEDLEKTYTVVAKNKKVALEIEYTSQVPQYLLGKHLRLHRILMNLLGNALKFTKEGRVKLLVEKAQDTPEKTVLRFSVIDTGMGIPTDKHQTIFEPFTRLTPSFQGQYPGSGLGLHVVKDYVEKMQGEIYVESEEGKGAMFTCVLPFKKPLLDNDNDVVDTHYYKNIMQEEVKLPIYDAAIQKTAAAAIGTESLVNNLVLLVEDDKTAQMMGEMLLKKNGYQVDVASSGEEALSLTVRNTYAVIYMDLGLGDGIDGAETTRRIRADQKNLNQHTFITALTAHGSSDEEIVKKCKNSGMQHILSKPLTTEKIIQMQNMASKGESADDNEKSVIDFDLWHARLGHAAHLLEKLVHILGDEFPSYREKIKNAYEAGDLATLKAVTHKFKGALFSSGYPRLEAAIVAIESAAKQANNDDVDKWYPETMEALDEAEEAYKKWVRTHPKQG